VDGETRAPHVRRKIVYVFSAVRLNEGHDFIAAIALTSGEIEEFIDARNHGASLGRTHHTHAATPREVEQALVAKYVQCPNDRILVNAQDSGEIDRRRKPLTLSRLTVGNRPSNFRCHLIVQ